MQPTSQSAALGNRYQLLDQIGHGGMGTIYRALDRLTGQAVALKRLHTTSNDAFRLALTQEFRTLSSLRHPHIISVLDYGFDAERQSYFTMELLENAQTIIGYGAAQPLQRKIDLLAQTLQALAYLHRHGIVHRDLKPDNVLVVNEQVKVLDFGLAIAREKVEVSDTVSGTIAYLAPEVLQGGLASEQSDLYALGIIAYELLSGHYPFKTDTVSGLVQAILLEQPDVDALDVSAEIKTLIAELLAKDPLNRCANAYEALRAIQSFQPDAVREDELIRESYLQAAKFVGREAELAQLTDAFKRAAQGQGSAWLVAGESGVGKSRLLDEFRIQALVEGALVLRGQAAPESSMPYPLWHQITRPLILGASLTDVEIAVLKAVVPDIETLVGRSPQGTQINPEEAPELLLQAIDSLLSQQTAPVVLLLEDLQWAGEELTILARLNQRIGSRALMIVGNYRDDERPRLPDELPDMQVIRLKRLDTEAVTALSASILGEAGTRPDFVGFLQEQTEGNVFFLIEVMRTLARQTNDLNQIVYVTLPGSVFAGGIQKVIQHRLEQVPSEYQPLLDIAAILGRQLDLDALRYWFPDARLERILLACSEAAVFDIQDETWRFAHDKIREAIVSQMEREYKQTLHRQAAETLWALYGENADTQAAAIAEHYEAAQETALAAKWYERAADYHQQVYAVQAAVDYYRKALQYGTPNRVRVLRELGQMLRLQAKNAESVSVYEQMTEAAAELGDPVLQAEAWNWLSWGQEARADFDAALESALKAAEFARQGGDAALAELARATYNIGWSYYRQSNANEASRYAEEAYTLSERAGLDEEQIRACNLLSALYYMQGQYRKAITYSERILEFIERTGKMSRSKSTVLGNLGSFYQSVKQYDKALECFTRSLEEARRINDLDSEMVTVVNRAHTLCMLERYDEAEEAIAHVFTHPELEEWFALTTAYYVQSKVHLGHGRLADALSALQQSYFYCEKFQQRDYTADLFLFLATLAEKAGMPLPMNGVEYDARGAFRKSLELYQELELPLACAEVLHDWAAFEERQGNTAEAERLRLEQRRCEEQGRGGVASDSHN